MMNEFNGVAIVIAHWLTTVRNCDNIVVMENGMKVEEGTHEELMRIQVIKDDDVQVTQGYMYFHNQWDTQMGEETFGEASHMNDEQLNTKKVWWAKQIEDVEKEVQKRGLTIRQLRELEPETTGEQLETDSGEADDEEADDEGAEDPLLLLPTIRMRTSRRLRSRATTGVSEEGRSSLLLRSHVCHLNVFSGMPIDCVHCPPLSSPTPHAQHAFPRGAFLTRCSGRAASMPSPASPS